MLSSDVVFVLLLCKSLLYLSNEVSYIFLVLSAKTNILADELIKSFAKVSWKQVFVSRSLMFFQFITSSSKGYNSKTVGGVLLLVFSWLFSPTGAAKVKSAFSILFGHVSIDFLVLHNLLQPSCYSDECTTVVGIHDPWSSSSSEKCFKAS